MIIFKPYDDDTFTCHSHECVQVIDMPTMGGELLILNPVPGFEPVPAHAQNRPGSASWHENHIKVSLADASAIVSALSLPQFWHENERCRMANELRTSIGEVDEANRARRRLTENFPRQKARCDVCGAGKGLHAVGEGCNNNCGGRVVAC